MRAWPNRPRPAYAEKSPTASRRRLRSIELMERARMMKFTAEQHMRFARLLGQKSMRTSDPALRQTLRQSANQFRSLAQRLARVEKARAMPQAIWPEAPSAESRFRAPPKPMQRRAQTSPISSLLMATRDRA